MPRLLAGLLFAALMTLVMHQGVAHAADTQAINRIVDEGLNHSELAETAFYLTDRIGGRMTNSPQMRAAEKWTQEQFRGWGLANVHTEGFEFGRGWSIEKASVRLMTPRVVQLRTIPVAWTPATQGAVTAPVMFAPMTRERDFAKWKGKLRGQIVLVSKPLDGSEPDEAPFIRLTDDQLAKKDVYRQPVHSEAALKKSLKQAVFAAKRDAFLAEEGAIAWIRTSYRDGGLLHGEGYGHRVGETAKLPGLELAAEDYGQVARFTKAGPAPTLEILSDVRFHDEDTKAYNVIADIPGKDRKAGYVMAGAHLDSWVASTGASDNAAGSAAIMEAARILSKLGVKPKRTIRFALWSGEEQGLYGSMAYVDQHFVTRPPVTDPEQAKLSSYYLWAHRWPITAKPGYQELAAYFNIDNGSGKIRGIHTDGNVAVVPIFKDWLAPFASMGATTVATAPTGGTDHVFMRTIGLPAFQFIQDPLDYDSRVHHTSVDSFDHLKIGDLKQAAVILAAFLLKAADADEPLPRMPLPTKPKDTNPFDYTDADADAEEASDE